VPLSKINCKLYAGCWVIVTGKGCYEAAYVPFDDHNFEKNEMGLKHVLNPEKYYKEICKEESYDKEEKITISDATNAEI